MGNFDILAQRLKALRAEMSLTQKEFSEKIGFTQATLSAYENGQKKPSLDIIMEIAKQCNVSIDWLCGLTNEMNNEDDIKTYSDLIRLFLKIQNLEMAPSGFSLVATTKENGIVTGNNEMYPIIRNIQKMQSILNDGTLDQELYNTWLDGFLKKHNVPLPTWRSISSDDPPELPEE